MPARVPLQDTSNIASGRGARNVQRSESSSPEENAVSRVPLLRKSSGVAEMRQRVCAGNGWRHSPTDPPIATGYRRGE
jgi:hypothetical protein